MKNIIMVFVVAVIAGCTNPTKKVDTIKGLEAFYRQGGPDAKREYTPLRFSSKGATKINIEGNDIEVQMDSPLEIARAMPSEPGVLQKLIDNAFAFGKFGLGVWGAASVAKPTIIEQPPAQIVRPQVVEPTVVMGE